MNTDDRFKALDQATLAIEKKYGKGTMISENNKDSIFIPRWPLSSPNLNHILGGGLPKGRIIEIYGPESSAKTSLAVMMGADVQKQGGHVTFIDAEFAFDFEHSNHIGLSTSSKNFILCQPDFGEQAFDIAEELIRNKATDYIILDSVSALTPKAELEGNYGDAHMALQARLMSQGLRKITGLLNKSECTLVFINQIRMKIGIMFGNPETVSGGKALKFYSSIRLDTRKFENITEGNADNIVGIKTRVKVVKNKTAPPFRKAEFDFYFDSGFNTEKEFFDLAVTYKIIDKAGAWYSYKEEKLGQGKDNSVLFLESKPEIFEEIKIKVNNMLFNKNKDEETKEKSKSNMDKLKEKVSFQEEVSEEIAIDNEVPIRGKGRSKKVDKE